LQKLFYVYTFFLHFVKIISRDSNLTYTHSIIKDFPISRFLCVFPQTKKASCRGRW